MKVNFYVKTHLHSLVIPITESVKRGIKTLSFLIFILNFYFRLCELLESFKLNQNTSLVYMRD